MKKIVWKIYLKSSPQKVFNFLTTEKGREKFWAEKAFEKEGVIHFTFPNGEYYDSRIIKTIVNKEFQLDYFHSLVKFKLEPCSDGGTNLTLTNEGVPESDFMEVHAGWVSVLLNLKAAADFQVDLRNHNKTKTWNEGYVDN